MKNRHRDDADAGWITNLAAVFCLLGRNRNHSSVKNICHSIVNSSDELEVNYLITKGYAQPSNAKGVWGKKE